jgi:NAD(P)-dependent dehydrogenase (short-subunit alcohol dehydrogenase family)
MPPVSTYRSGFRPGLFASQSVIVSGGGSGMGRCTAHEFAALRASVALVGRRRRIVIMETRPAGKGEPEGSLAAGMVHLGTEPTRKST